MMNFNSTYLLLLDVFYLIYKMCQLKCSYDGINWKNESSGSHCFLTTVPWRTTDAYKLSYFIFLNNSWLNMIPLSPGLTFLANSPFLTHSWDGDSGDFLSVLMCFLPMITSLTFLNKLPCNGFVKKLADISSAGQ